MIKQNKKLELEQKRWRIYSKMEKVSNDKEFLIRLRRRTQTEEVNQQELKRWLADERIKRYLTPELEKIIKKFSFLEITSFRIKPEDKRRFVLFLKKTIGPLGPGEESELVALERKQGKELKEAAKLEKIATYLSYKDGNAKIELEERYGETIRLPQLFDEPEVYKGKSRYKDHEKIFAFAKREAFRAEDRTKILIKEDVFSEIMIHLSKNQYRYNPLKKGSLTTWFYTVIRNKTNDIINKAMGKKKKPGRFMESIEERAEKGKSIGEFPTFIIPENFDIPLAIKKLSPKLKEAIELYFFEGLTQVEAGKKLDISQQDFSERLNEALREMRKVLLRP